VLRGPAGPSRSDAFDFERAIRGLSNHKGQLTDDGPTEPVAMFVCFTYIMLRELEASESAVDVEDVFFTDKEATLTLPVSKIDWQAKSCRRSRKCLCDKGLVCPFR
jgi:hypothetical protein